MGKGFEQTFLKAQHTNENIINCQVNASQNHSETPNNCWDCYYQKSQKIMIAGEVGRKENPYTLLVGM